MASIKEIKVDQSNSQHINNGMVSEANSTSNTQYRLKMIVYFKQHKMVTRYFYFYLNRMKDVPSFIACVGSNFWQPKSSFSGYDRIWQI